MIDLIMGICISYCIEHNMCMYRRAQMCVRRDRKTGICVRRVNTTRATYHNVSAHRGFVDDFKDSSQTGELD